MKKIYFVAGLMVLAGIYLLTQAAGDLSEYSSFDDAVRTGKKVKIVGTLAKDKEMHYDPVKDPNYFTFFVTDNDGQEKKVVLHSSKPQDFELSEQIVLTGQMKGEDFVATDLLMKCPSKYKDEEIYIRGQEEPASSDSKS